MTSAQQYVPHRPPMRLVEQVIEASPEQAICEAVVSEDNVFYDPALNGIPAWAGLEYLAQTAAVWLGADCERQGQPVKPAFLVSSREYTAHRVVWAVGERVRIRVRPQWQDLPLVSFTGDIYDHRQERLAEAVFAAYQPHSFDEYLAANAPDNVK